MFRAFTLRDDNDVVLRALRWSAIDFELRLLTVRAAFKGGGSRLGKTKSEKGRAKSVGRDGIL